MSSLFAIHFSPDVRYLPHKLAIGCSSLTGPAILSISYDTTHRLATLYRTWPSRQVHTVEIYKASELGSARQPTFFTSRDTGAVLTVQFGSKSLMSVIEADTRTEYFCEYYRLETN